MKSMQGATRMSFLMFFASHIPITLLVDSQAVLPRSLYPDSLVDLVSWYAESFHDPLMMDPPVWFSAIVACELLFQLPFFVVAVSMLYQGNVSNRWFRMACIIYGSHTSTTLIPILAVIGLNPETTSMQKAVTLSFYFPYLFFPMWLVYIAASSDKVVEATGSPLRAKVL